MTGTFEQILRQRLRRFSPAVVAEALKRARESLEHGAELNHALAVGYRYAKSRRPPEPPNHPPARQAA